MPYGTAPTGNTAQIGSVYRRLVIINPRSAPHADASFGETRQSAGISPQLGSAQSRFDRLKVFAVKRDARRVAALSGFQRCEALRVRIAVSHSVFLSLIAQIAHASYFLSEIHLAVQRETQTH